MRTDVFTYKQRDRNKQYTVVQIYVQDVPPEEVDVETGLSVYSQPIPDTLSSASLTQV